MDTGSTQETTGENPFLRTCSQDTREALFERGQVLMFGRGEMLFAQGEPAARVLLPLRGELRMSKTASRGRRQVICNVSPERCGGICMLALPDQGLADIWSVERGEILVLERDDFKALARLDQTLCEAAWGATAECMTHFAGLVENLSFQKVAQRVAAALLSSTENDGDLVYRTQAELAAEVGTTREVVARCLAGLQNAGIVRLGRARITVLDRAKLQERTRRD